MRILKQIYKFVAYSMCLFLMGSCATEIEMPGEGSRGMRAYAEVRLGDLNLYESETRASTNAYDGWAISAFSEGDVVGMYAVTGRQNPENLEEYTEPVENEQMFFEGRTGNYYRFGNAEIVLDPSKVNSKYSMMYYPYFKDMPDPEIYLPSVEMKGIRLRRTDTDGIEKCIDFMRTSGNYIALTDGIMKPSFTHQFFNLVIQRGEGFDDPEDSHVWVVMKKPYTDIRITRYQYSNSVGEYQYTLQYVPDEGEEVMGRIYGEQPKFDVNKYAVWEAWTGNPYKKIDSQYAILPPGDVSFILIQDNLGNWHNVTDFYLYGTGSKEGKSGNRYVINISLQGIDVVVRPVMITPWDEELEISDNRKVGIHDDGEYYKWVTTYNTYTANGRTGDDLIDELRNYGDGVDDGNGNIKWTFYINHDIDFTHAGDFAMIMNLDDILEGSSTYTNYEIKGVSGDLIDRMGENGVLRALDFRDLYVIQAEGNDDFFGGLVNVLDNGTIDNCNIYNAVVVANGPVGIVAGTVNNGTVKNCTFSGDIIGAKAMDSMLDDGKWVRGLFGTINGNQTLSNINVTGLQFIEN